MAFENNTVRSEVFKHFSTEEQQKYFGLKLKNVIHGIDTLYFTIFLKEQEDKVSQMLKQLEIWKDEYKSGNEDLFFNDMQYLPFHFCHYEHCFRVENMFDIFIASYLPNPDTPRVVVQLRSIGLWLKHYENLIPQAVNEFFKFIDCFSIKIEKIRINRIDYAYHTNLIQNTSKYFSDTVLLNNLKTKLRIYQKVGKITDRIEVDYLSLGNRKSNNIFFRAYNKSREVVEKQYKGFFINLWYDEGLISYYDKYCLEKGYKAGSYNVAQIARIDFYLEYGTDTNLKAKLADLRKKCYENSDNYTYIRKTLRGLLPEITNIMNIEYQCKSKFFKTFDNEIQSLPSGIHSFVGDVEPLLVPMYKLLRSTRVVTDYLLKEIVCFKDKDGDYLYWWKRILQCKVWTVYKGDLHREYINGIDMERLKSKIVNSLAGMSIYKNNVNRQDLTSDIADFICVLNDNDIANITINPETGQALEFKYKDYDKIKKRKARQIKPLLNKGNVANETS